MQRPWMAGQMLHPSQRDIFLLRDAAVRDDRDAQGSDHVANGLPIRGPDVLLVLFPRT